MTLGEDAALEARIVELAQQAGTRPAQYWRELCVTVREDAGLTRYAFDELDMYGLIVAWLAVHRSNRLPEPQPWPDDHNGEHTLRLTRSSWVE